MSPRRSFSIYKRCVEEAWASIAMKLLKENVRFSNTFSDFKTLKTYGGINLTTEKQYKKQKNFAFSPLFVKTAPLTELSLSFHSLCFLTKVQE